MAHDMAGLNLIANILIRVSLLMSVGWLAFGWASRQNPRLAVLMMRLTIVGCVVLPVAYVCLPSAKLPLLPHQSTRSGVPTRNTPQPISADAERQPASVEQQTHSAVPTHMQARADTPASPLHPVAEGQIPGSNNGHSSQNVQTQPAASSENGSRRAHADNLRAEGLSTPTRKGPDSSPGPVQPSTSNPAIRQPIAAAPRAMGWLLGCWLAGSILSAIKLGLGYYQTYRLVKSGTVTSTQVIHYCLEISAQLGVRSARGPAQGRALVGACYDRPAGLGARRRRGFRIAAHRNPAYPRHRLHPRLLHLRPIRPRHDAPPFPSPRAPLLP